ncbi:hypothetical protein ABZ942_13355 [Nocardia sp. NPDC046473]|uniref:hypothetical protein n=1 Tax=Nocardia sp. NPDC046473 TaxID=3155733 RepID=UPI0033D7F4DE
MTTTYPTDDLYPVVPRDRWAATLISSDNQVVSDPEMADLGYMTTVLACGVDAATVDEAERRILTWLAHDFEDDLAGWAATAIAESTPGRWRVEVHCPPYR